MRRRRLSICFDQLCLWRREVGEEIPLGVTASNGAKGLPDEFLHGTRSEAGTFSEDLRFTNSFHHVDGDNVSAPLAFAF